MEKFAVTKHSKKFWLDRVYKPEIRRRDGTKTVSDNYAVRLHHAGKEARLSLGTPNQEEAASLARDWFVFLSANGWPAFLAKYRNPPPPPRPGPSSGDPKGASSVTVGDFLAAVRAESDLAHKTFKDYAVCFRFVISEIYKLEKTNGRHDYRKGGRAAWVKRIEAIALADITADKIRTWKRAYIDQAGRDELQRRRRTVSVNSYLRRARAVFAPKVLSKLRSIQLPQPLPFDGVSLEKRTDTRFYGCGVEPAELVRAAVSELKPEELKAFLLAITLGLRRKEIDLLPWSAFDFGAGVLRVLPNSWHGLKTDESAAELLLEPEILKLFRGWRARAKSEFVLESDREPKVTDYQVYRCQETFENLLGWLRQKGITAHKPFHTLRKVYGSAVADAHGLHAASAALRHADIQTTAAYYLDRRVRVTSGLGNVLSGAEVLTLPKPGESAGTRPRRAGRASKNL